MENFTRNNNTEEKLQVIEDKIYEIVDKLPLGVRVSIDYFRVRRLSEHFLETDEEITKESVFKELDLPMGDTKNNARDIFAFMR